MKLKKIFALASLIIISSSFYELHFQKKPWPVPDAAKNRKNPVISNAESMAAGKTLWTTHCKSCHGVKGLGDGPKAAQLNTEPGDFSKNDVQVQSDGSLFYKTSEGRDDMPGFKKKFPDQEDIWKLVIYMRTFKKGGTTIIAPKDSIIKIPDKQIKTDNPPLKKDSIVKKENPVLPKTENIPLQEQVNALKARIDSLEKEFTLLKEKMNALKKDTASHHR